MGESKWLRVSKRHPCPVCQKQDWCTYDSDGSAVKCMRIASEMPVKGDWGGWIHRLGGEMQRPRLPYVSKPKVKVSTQDWMKIAQVAAQHEQAPGLRKRLAKDLGVSYDSLVKLCVGYGYDDFRGFSFSTWPLFNPRRQVMGIMRRYDVPVAQNGGNKLSMKGGSGGIYFAKGGSSLGDGSLCVVEGGSDTAALITLGIPVLGRPGAIGGASMIAELLKDFGRHIFVIGERDFKPERLGTAAQCPQDCDGCSWCYPGRHAAKVMAKSLKDLLPGKQITWNMAPRGFKDSRAWLVANPQGTASEFMRSLSKK